MAIVWVRYVVIGLMAIGVVSCDGANDHSALPNGPDELALHGGQFCPRTLPMASRATEGFGTEHPATASPTLPVPEQARICAYAPQEISPEHPGRAWFRWVRQGRPRRLDPPELTAFSAALERLRKPPTSYICHGDLGPRYLVSYANGQNLTGAVIDDFGCYWVHLTDDPFTDVPGAPTQPGTVRGVLTTPHGMLRELGVD